MYRIYKIQNEYSRVGYKGKEVAPDFFETMMRETALYPELIGEYEKREEALKAWEKAKEDYQYIEKLQNCRCWRGSYIELCTNEEPEYIEPSWGSDDFFVEDIQCPVYKEDDLKWVR